ncbi:hypothetical protein AB0I28_02475 [Phytomonospora sp. NPDC050363]|uniref:hypothetical protein n=1 Tax=Phytomonospora sp. NPDC050363 TaxID=3155642 RepID=UPI0033F4A376
MVEVKVMEVGASEVDVHGTPEPLEGLRAGVVAICFGAWVTEVVAYEALRGGTHLQLLRRPHLARRHHTPAFTVEFQLGWLATDWRVGWWHAQVGTPHVHHRTPALGVFLTEVVQGMKGADPYGGLLAAELVNRLGEQLLRAFLDRIMLRGGGNAFSMFEAAFGIGDAVGLVFELALVLGRGDDLPVD